MKKKILLLLVGMFAFQTGFVQNEYPWQGRVSDTRFDEASGRVEFLRFYEEEALTAPEFFDFLHASLQLAPGDRFEFKRHFDDAFGWKHLDFQQQHNGYPVEGAIFKAHTKNGKVLSMNGHSFPITHHPAQLIPEASALQNALAAVSANTYLWQDPAEVAQLRYATRNPSAGMQPIGELVYMKNQLGSSPEAWRLAYKFDVYAIDPLGREDVYVDAENGEVIFRHNKIHTIDRPGTAHTKHSWKRSIVADSANGEYTLRETGRAAGVETYNMRNTQSYSSAVDFVDDDNYWDTLDVAMIVGGTDGHWGAEMTFDYFFQQHGRNSFDGNGSLLLSYVNFGNNYGNAFWDGTRMTYGAGAGNQQPFSTLDVCGHEFAHGVTGTSAGLIYQDEYGALNESFSDIFGAAIEFFGRPDEANWLIGEEIGGIRSMSDPGAFGNPDTYKAGLWYTGSGDNGGVHFNSGVQNYWFYLLSVGGSGTNDIGNSYSVQGIGIDSAAAIAYRNLTVYLTPFSEYHDAQFFATQAAIDLFGPCSPQVRSTINAWHAVGLGVPYTGNLSASFTTYDSTSCSFPADVSFINQSESALSYLWDFGDGNTSTDLSPTHTYTSPGTYDVKLIAYGCGATATDTFFQAGRVIIDPSQPCVINMPGLNSITADGCLGTLYDSGGAFDYPNNTTSLVTIAPAGATSVSLTFSSFEYAPGDYIVIYDGPDMQSPNLGTFSGTNSPGTIISSGGSLTVREVTNGFNRRPGFVADWSCSTGIFGGTDDELSVYPNPARDQVRITKQLNGLDATELEVRDAYGRILIRKAFDGASQIDELLQLDNFAAGVYFVRVKAGDAILATKFTKQ